jgi:hypothetical protein
MPKNRVDGTRPPPSVIGAADETEKWLDDGADAPDQHRQWGNDDDDDAAARVEIDQFSPEPVETIRNRKKTVVCWIDDKERVHESTRGRRHAREQKGTIQSSPFLAPVSGRFVKPLLVGAAGSHARSFWLPASFVFFWALITCCWYFRLAS